MICVEGNLYKSKVFVLGLNLFADDFQIPIKQTRIKIEKHLRGMAISYNKIAYKGKLSLFRSTNSGLLTVLSCLLYEKTRCSTFFEDFNPWCKTRFGGRS